MLKRIIEFVDNSFAGCKKPKVGQSARKFLSPFPLFSLQQINYQQTLKLISIFFIGIACNQVMAVGEGFYIGVMGGLASNNGGQQTATVTLNPQTKGCPGITACSAMIPVTPRSQMGGFRLFMGYKYNYWLGGEMGGTIFSDVNYDHDDYSIAPASSSISAGVATVDFVAVGSLPIWQIFELYGKGGIVVAYQGQSRTIKPAIPGQTSNNRYQWSVGPTVTLGIAYAISQSVVVDLSATRFNVGGVLKSVDLYAIGISYHNVNVYCGQFLCDP